MRRASILIIAIASLLTAGCQSTPYTTPVIGKAADYLENVAEVEYVPYNAPEHVQFSNKIKELSLTIDANVNIPLVDGYSIMEVQKATFLDQDYIKIMDYFQPNSLWYDKPELTKSDIIEKIGDAYSSGNADNTENQIYIDYLKSLLETAPEETTLKDFSFEDYSNGQAFAAYCKNADLTYSSISGIYGENSLRFVHDAEVRVMREEYLESDDALRSDFIKEPDISMNEALDLAQQVMYDLKFDPMMKLSYAEKAVGYKNLTSITLGWEFIFMRDCNGLQSHYIDNYDLWLTSAAPSNAAPWDKECLFIFVDENGVSKIDLRGAGNHTACLFENVELLPFDEILTRIKNQLVYQHAYQDAKVEDYSVSVFQINLTSSLVNVKDRPDIGRMIPTWEVVYYFRIKYAEKETEEFKLHTLFNAIDGSYIEPRVSIAQINETYGI